MPDDYWNSEICDMKFTGNVHQHIFHELKQRQTRDVQIICGREGIWFHRILLAAVSPLFRELLQEETEEPVISLAGYSIEDVYALSRYIYEERRSERKIIPPIVADLGIVCTLCDLLNIEVPWQDGFHSCQVAQLSQSIVKGVCSSPSQQIPDEENNIGSEKVKKIRLVRVGQGKSQCLYCSYATKKMSSHVFTHHAEKFAEYKEVAGRKKSAWPQKCEYCDKMLINRTKMLRHLRSHERRNETGNGSQLVCEICAKFFDSQAAFSAHMRFHSKEMKCEVEHCQQSFHSRSLMREHLLCVHKREPKPSSSRRTGSNLFLCTDCGKHLTTKLGLLGHQRLFHSDRVVECNLCKEKFMSDAALKKHIARHGEPGFQCSDCQQKFYMKSDLHRHIRLKHMRGKFSCGTCFKNFLTKGNLRDHMNTHTGLKPFKCNACEKSYQNGSNLLAHKKSCHPEVYEKRKTY